VDRPVVGGEDHRAAPCGHDGLRRLGRIAEFEAAAVRLIPLVVEVDQYVDAAVERERLVEVG
jgi:hypothetical protein